MKKNKTKTKTKNKNKYIEPLVFSYILCKLFSPCREDQFAISYLQNTSIKTNWKKLENYRKFNGIW